MNGWMKLILFIFLFTIGFLGAYDVLLEKPIWSVDASYCDSSVTGALQDFWGDSDEYYSPGSDGYYCQKENKKRVEGAIFLSFALSAFIWGIIVHFSKEKGE